MNERAKSILNDPYNASYVSLTAGGDLGLEVGFRIPAARRPQVIVDIGRLADIRVADPCISHIQFSFEIHPESREIVFRDNSSNHETKISPYGFRTDGHFFQIILIPEVTYTIGIGGEEKDEYCFEVHWVKDNLDGPAKLDRGLQHAEMAVLIPELQRTITRDPIEPLKWYNKRLNSPANSKVKRVLKKRMIGAGAFGKVSKAVDIDSGCFVAVKEIMLPPSSVHAYKLIASLQREIVVLSRLSHTNIVEFLGFNESGPEGPCIYTALKAGSVTILFEQQPNLRSDDTVVRDLLKQGLRALAYLASQNLIHRDVKPDNILYKVISTGSYLFQLADFGLANDTDKARTHCGTRLFMAPEVYYDLPQTPKIDVWSLFASLMFLTQKCGLHYNIQGNYTRVQALLIFAAVKNPLYLPMAVADPNFRFTAAQMLEQKFGEAGNHSGNTRGEGGGATYPAPLKPSHMAMARPAPTSRLNEILELGFGEGKGGAAGGGADVGAGKDDVDLLSLASCLSTSHLNASCGEPPSGTSPTGIKMPQAQPKHQAGADPTTAQPHRGMGNRARLQRHKDARKHRKAPRKRKRGQQGVPKASPVDEHFRQK